MKNKKCVMYTKRFRIRIQKNLERRLHTLLVIWKSQTGLWITRWGDIKIHVRLKTNRKKKELTLHNLRKMQLSFKHKTLLGLFVELISDAHPIEVCVFKWFYRMKKPHFLIQIIHIFIHNWNLRPVMSDNKRNLLCIIYV